MSTMLRMAVAAVVSIAFGSLGACSSILEPNERVIYQVAPHTVACIGVAPQRCLLVRREPATEWTYFYDSIEGFAYQEGYHWRIQVERRRVSNPPVDASSHAYQLVRVLSRERAQ